MTSKGNTESLAKVGVKEGFNLLPWDIVTVATIIKIGVIGAGDDIELLIIAFQTCKGVFTHVKTMRLFTMNTKHSTLDLARVIQESRIEIRERTCCIPAGR